MSVLGSTLLVVALLPARPPSAAAQVPSRAPHGVGGVGSIEGAVYDSLIGAWLEGAHVRIHGTNLLATADREGRFRLDSVPSGSRVLVLDHPALDSAGLSDLPMRITVAAERVTRVVLAVPSLHTFATTVCAGAPPPAGGDSGIVFGP